RHAPRPAAPRSAVRPVASHTCPTRRSSDLDRLGAGDDGLGDVARLVEATVGDDRDPGRVGGERGVVDGGDLRGPDPGHHAGGAEDRKSTRLNSSHVSISYAVFCLKTEPTAL